MSEPFQPNPGDTVEFYNNEAELWEPGTVFSHSADRRTYFVQPDSENLPMYGVYYTNVRPVSSTDDTAPKSSNGDIPSFWEAAKTFCRTARVSCDLANDLELQLTKARAELWKTGQERDYWKNRAEITHLQHVAANKRADGLEDELKEMTEYAEEVRARSEENYLRAVKAEALIGPHVRDRLAEYRERTHAAEDRAEKAEAIAERESQRAAKFELQAEESRNRVANLKSDRNEWRTRAEKAEATLDDIARILVPRHELDAAEARIEELEDQVRVLKSERETVAENAVRWQEHSRKISAVLAGHQAETWTDHDGTVRPLGAISRADLARQLYDENERAGQEKARADKAETELAELKAALRTLAGDNS